MSRMSKCATSRQYNRPLPKRTLATFFACGAACLAFFFAQLNLRFSVHDMEQETTRLQNRKMELRSELNRMKSEVESRKQSDRLLQHAQTDLGMVAYSPGDVERVSISGEIRDRYANIQIARAKPASSGPEARNEKAWAEALASRLGVSGRALAAQSED